ncbi:putative DNA polymerase zeta catalytic subunit [Trypanosoma conorhini]|uniref:DNA polymerase n=1 Tax=Trypanosoma conorhini TaxID=83891 RepID=A0A3R7N9C4_9TRYP|nr:putative DNA polymerase zeta catalytic subunit [Trypanosoma conorhini]RNF27589.1 putative DNA polymerase zeta catalytic subunit [Trypanosoma conorhini]
MHLHVVSVEHSVANPEPALGDSQMSPLFHRVSARCPLLHLFGYVHTRREGGGGPEALQQRSVCAHVHGVYPYFMVLRHDPGVSAMQFGAQLEAVAIRLLKPSAPTAAPPPQLLHHVEVVRRLPFYGYHARHKTFFKVSVIDPQLVGSLLRLLRQTTEVGGRRWQTYDAHTPYHFQFMVDYGMKGMAPFCIPSCTARTPVPKDVQPTQLQTNLRVTAVMPRGEPLRLTRAELEIDVKASVLRRRECPAETGENLLSVRRSMREYFAEHGVDDALRCGAGLDIADRSCTASDVQNSDSAVRVMRQRALMHLRARANTAKAESPSHISSTPRDGVETHTAFSPSAGKLSGHLTLQLMEEMHGESAEAACLALSVSTSSLASSSSAASSAFLVSVPSVGEAGRDAGERSSHSSEGGDRMRAAPVAADASLVVGDSVAVVGVPVDGGASPAPSVAKITAMDAQTVRLRWYMTLRETHLADAQEALERSGRWLARRAPDAGSAAAAEEELLLGDVEDDNPIDVLKQAVRVAVYHEYSACKSPALLCRYNYHVSEQRLSEISPARSGEPVALPAALAAPPATGAVGAGVVEEDAELLTSPPSSSSSLFSSPSSCGAAAERREFAPPLSLSRPSTHGGNCTPAPLRRSVSSVAQQAAQSQLSLLLSCVGSSPPATAIVHAVASPPVASEAGGNVEPPSASLECVSPRQVALLQECREASFCLRPCHFMGDIARNFRWTYDQQHHSIAVSAASWPLATPSSTASSSHAPAAASTRGGMPRATVGALPARPSVPLLSHVAPSPWVSPSHQRASAAKAPKWQPHPSSNASRSLGRGTYTTCELRVMCVEVLVHRQPGTQNVVQDELLAVALGRTNSSAEFIGVRIFCVCPATMAMNCLQQPFSGVVDVVPLPSELHLLQRVRRELCSYDPDILLSWEGCKYGVGLLALRYRLVLRRSLARDVARLAIHGVGDATGEAGDERDAVGDAASADDELWLSSSSSSSSSSAGDGEGVAAPETAGASAAAASQLGTADMIRRLSRRFGGGVRVAGRVVVDLGRQLRKELRLPSHTLQMVHQKLFRRSLPYFTDVALAEMYTGRSADMRRVALSVLLTRVVTPHRVARHLDFYTRTMEFARMYGILFYEVLTRGSQYRVEATLHRMARPLGYAMLSPSPEEVHRQPRLVSMPLIMQPRSGFYKDDPVVVLDFRSLYPSIVIAYNLCYSTCLGRVSKCRRGRLGVLASYRQADPLLLRLLAEDDALLAAHRVTVAPNGCMFLSPEIRRGVLPQMLQALLDTRLQVLAALRHVAQPCEDKHMQRVLQQQQTAIKLLANTTYGYTAASFTGRMPCVDVADATVMLARQTLERAMRLINGHPSWNAEVVYGDTDSLFVRLPGRTKEEAFLLGEQMAREVSRINPAPIQLQFEKVLFPCLLLVKKRYAGYAYFKPDQKQPEFLARGIETVRRDQCPATSRLAERMLQLLFAGASTDVLRTRFYEEVGKLQRGGCNPADCIFRKAVKLGRYRDEAHLPPGAHLAMQLIEKDITRTPYWGERMPYIVVQPQASLRLRDQVVHPQRLLSLRESLRVDHEYYIKRHIIPTLDRMFYLIGVSFARWYALMPRRRSCQSYFGLGVATLPRSGKKTPRTPREHPIVVGDDTDADTDHGGASLPLAALACRPRQRTLDAHCHRTLCAVCLEACSETRPPDPPVCGGCLRNRRASAVRVVGRRRRVEQELRLLETACRRCIASCGEAGGANFLAGEERDMEDMHFAIPHQLAAAASTALHGDGSRGCLSIDCYLSFEKSQVFLLYSQLMALENYLARLCVTA